MTCGVLFGARRRARARRRCVPRRVSASAKARGLAALPSSGGLGRYWAAQWHSARAVGKRFRGCRAKRLYVHSVSKRFHPGRELSQVRSRAYHRTRSRVLAPHWAAKDRSGRGLTSYWVGERQVCSRTFWNRRSPRDREDTTFPALNLSSPSKWRLGRVCLARGTSLPLLVSFIPAHAPEGVLPFLPAFFRDVWVLPKTAQVARFDLAMHPLHVHDGGRGRRCRGRRQGALGFRR